MEDFRYTVHKEHSSSTPYPTLVSYARKSSAEEFSYYVYYVRKVQNASLKFFIFMDKHTFLGTYNPLILACQQS